MLAMTGYGSAIGRDLRTLLPEGETCVRWRHGSGKLEAPFLRAERWVLAAGVLHGYPPSSLSTREWQETMEVNLQYPMQLCEVILARRPNVRIVCVGSVSGEQGSYDQVYAAAKAGMHLYVRTRETGPEQQLTCVAPGIIRDAGMTLRRADCAAAQARSVIDAIDVARLIHYLLYVAKPKTHDREVIVCGRHR